jgi:UDPglucose 6-dehydrogenase
MTPPTVGFAGLTHLGLVSAAAVAARGFRVVAFDPESARVGAIVAGELQIAEPGLAELLHEQRDRLTFAADAAVLGRCDVVYVAADVPTDEAGRSDLASIARLVDVVRPQLRPTGVLVVLCQVPPGFTRRIALPSKRLFYQVETLVFGRAVERAQRPERIIVGAAEPLQPLPEAYRGVLESFECPILPMRYESAELAKIAINCCLAGSISVANTLAELCGRVGADWSEIVPALRSDRRIGEHAYLAPGLGLSGGNLERDLATVLAVAAEAGSYAGVIEAFVEDSRRRCDWVLRVLHAEGLPKKRDAIVGILGLAYKEHTRSTKNSAALALAGALKPWRLRVYDPVVPASAVNHPRAVGVDAPLEVARGAEALAIMTPWPEVRQVHPAEIAAAMTGWTVVDPYRALDGEAVAAAGLDYFALGRPPLRGARREAERA